MASTKIYVNYKYMDAKERNEKITFTVEKVTSVLETTIFKDRNDFSNAWGNFLGLANEFHPGRLIASEVVVGSDVNPDIIDYLRASGSPFTIQ